MAGILLRETICLVFPGRDLSGLRQTGGGLWSRRSEGDQAGRGRPHAEEGLLDPKPVIIDFVVDREENVYPMVPAGEPLNQMRLV